MYRLTWYPSSCTAPLLSRNIVSAMSLNGFPTKKSRSFREYTSFDAPYEYSTAQGAAEGMEAEEREVMRLHTRVDRPG